MTGKQLGRRHRPSGATCSVPATAGLSQRKPQHVPLLPLAARRSRRRQGLQVPARTAHNVEIHAAAAGRDAASPLRCWSPSRCWSPASALGGSPGPCSDACCSVEAARGEAGTALGQCLLGEGGLPPGGTLHAAVADLLRCACAPLPPCKHSQTGLQELHVHAHSAPQLQQRAAEGLRVAAAQRPSCVALRLASVTSLA